MSAGQPAAPRVRLVVLNHDNGDDLPACLTALGELRWPGPVPEVVVVDNASTDGSVAMVRERFPSVRVIENPTNTGFGANNLGLDDLDGIDLVGLVNPDTEVDPGWLVESAAVLGSDPSIGAVTPTLVFPPQFAELAVAIDPPGEVRLVDAPGVTRPDLVHRVGAAETGLPVRLADGCVLRVPLDPAGGPSPLRLGLSSTGREKVTVAIATASTVVAPGASGRVLVDVGPARVTVVQNRGIEPDATGNGHNLGFLEAHDATASEPVEVFGWCGAAVLARADYFADVGLFEERLFLYYEDLDLSWRARARGWRHVHAPAALVRHHHGASRNPDIAQRYGARNRLLVSTRNAPLAGVARAWGAAVAGCARLAARGSRCPRSRHLAAVRARGLAEAVALLPWAVHTRRRLRRGARLGDHR